MASTRVAAVTGANKGIGLAIVRNLALQYPKSALNSPPAPLLIYLTARSSTRGEEALAKLRQDERLRGVLRGVGAAGEAGAGAGGEIDVKYRQLDISSEGSIGEFAAFLKKQHPEGIDLLVNNAGIALDGFDSDIVRQTIATNYHGTLALTRALLPLLKSDSTARIVNVSSMIGKLNKYSPEITQRFRSAAARGSVSETTALMDEYASAVSDGTHTAKGWPNTAYGVSKAGVTGMTAGLSKEEEVVKKGLLVNCCCPGYVNTDMSKGRGRKSVDQGAETPVLLGVGEIGGRTGEYWSGGEVAEW